MLEMAGDGDIPPPTVVLFGLTNMVATIKRLNVFKIRSDEVFDHYLFSE